MANIPISGLQWGWLHSCDIKWDQGLGLTIIRRVVERHNGQIWIESEAGKGSKFYVVLPRS